MHTECSQCLVVTNPILDDRTVSDQLTVFLSIGGSDAAIHHKYYTDIISLLLSLLL